MPDSLSPVLHALDAHAGELTLFVRDDDAGWHDAPLLALVDELAAAAVPLDLAVIPAATSATLAEALCARIDADPAALAVHQHGWAHLNHETTGRRCEFGPARALAAQRADLIAGRGRLRTLFSHRLDACFTPPWNRCASATPALLAELGYAALSRDSTAPAQGELPELRVALDWCRHRHGGRLDVPALAAAFAGAVHTCPANQPLGLMLHHAQMDAAERGLLARWLHRLRSHPGTRWQLMRQALASHSAQVQ